jgi:uncharacterized cupredoxin-like copper-binding protein
MKKLFALITIAMLFAAACTPAANATQTSPSASPSAITVTLTDNKIDTSSKIAAAGTVTFNVTNKGAMEHELVVLKTDLADDKIPPDADEPGKVAEDGNVGESGDLEAGTAKTFTITLPAGSYVLMCNEIGHYALGMHLAFTVK